MSFLDRIAACNNHDPAQFRPFFVAGRQMGLINHAFAARLEAFPSVFEVEPASVTLSMGLGDFEDRSAAMAEVLRDLAGQGVIKGWRDELFPVANGFGHAPLMQIERAAVPLFGLRAFGVFVNGYVWDGDDLKLWIARRSRTKPSWPGMLDVFVGGGQPIGIGLMDNLIKETAEEANVPPALARQARPVGAISYRMNIGGGFRPDTEFVFDLELPMNFVPRNTDGEIEAFYLWQVEQVMQTVRDTDHFKPNCNLALIDFFVRHGLLTPDEPDYLEILSGLRQ